MQSPQQIWFYWNNLSCCKMKVGRRYLEKNAHPISPVLGWFQTTVGAK